ncbi:unnamed protein product, partial [marine sediment metagenome]
AKRLPYGRVQGGVLNNMKILNLYAGLGGNRKNWEDCEVTAVESNQQIADAYRKVFPDDLVVVGDAHHILPSMPGSITEPDFIWSSPPCQSHSRMQLSGRNRTPMYADMALWQEIIFLQTHFKGNWVIENVVPYYEPLVKPTVKRGRHLFWSNMDLSFVQDVPSPKNFIKTQDKAALLEWLGMPDPGNIYYDGNHDPLQVLRNCVHPFIGEQIMEIAQNA